LSCCTGSAGGGDDGGHLNINNTVPNTLGHNIISVVVKQRDSLLFAVLLIMIFAAVEWIGLALRNF
jgi:hypothetical protein